MTLSLTSFRPINVQVNETSYPGFKREVTEKCVILDTVTYLLAKRVTYTQRGDSILSEAHLVVPKIDDPITELAARWIKKYYYHEKGLRFPFFIMGGKELQERLFYEAENDILLRLGFTKTPIKDEFNDEELELLDVKREELPFFRLHHPELYPKRLSCFSYGLLKAKEPGIREHLFFPKGPETGRTALFIQRLFQWGYSTVQDPKCGDFMLHLKEGRMTHMSRVAEDGFVDSKTGDNSPDYSRYPANLYWTSEGVQVLFFRKIGPGSYPAELSPTHKLLHTIP